jgi:hypothetical protein
MVTDTGRVKLTDFGIAQSAEDTHLTTSGILVGSPVYMAPERLRGEDADAGSDLWALGAVLFFAVEGYAAFERSSTAATMHAILNEVPFLSRCQGPLAAVITGLLNSHPDARPSAAQVRALLAQATGTPPAGVTMPVGGTAMIGGTALYQGPAQRRRSAKPWVIAAAVAAVVLLAGGYFLRVVTEPDPPAPAGLQPTLTYGDGGHLAELSWQTYTDGRCFDSGLERGRSVTENSHVECTEPHNLEFFDVRTVWTPPEEYDTHVDIEYPGEASLAAFAESICTLMFGSERITDTRGLAYRALVPAEKQWDENRNIVCALHQEDYSQMTESRVSTRDDE